MIDTLIVLVKLVAAHLIGDFIFQSDKMCQRKVSANQYRKFTSLSLHAGIQGGLTYIFLAEWDNWLIPVIIGGAHFFIDWIKSIVTNKGLKTFVIDQIAHLIVIGFIWWIYYVKLHHSAEISQYIFSIKTWIIFTAFIAILSPTSILIKLFLEYEKWTPKSDCYKGLPNAGKWIGYLERILILTFILTDNIEGVGFLLAAKSIFRFGELNKAKDLKVTEYVLIGTLLSFTLAISIAYVSLFIINLTME